MNSKIYNLSLCAIAIAINIVLGNIVSLFQIPFLFLDTIGTLFIAAIFGPIYGLAVGTATSLLAPILLGNFTFSLFVIVSASVGLFSGIMFKKMKFTPLSMIIIGIVISVISAFIGSWIKLIVFGGYSGELSDIAFALLSNSGLSEFISMFISRFSYNIVDKILSCYIVYILYNKLKKRGVRLPNKVSA